MNLHSSAKEEEAGDHCKFQAVHAKKLPQNKQDEKNKLKSSTRALATPRKQKHRGGEGQEPRPGAEAGLQQDPKRP